jgi:hypothetical protein
VQLRRLSMVEKWFGPTAMFVLVVYLVAIAIIVVGD